MLLCERDELLFVGFGGNARDEHCAIGQDRLGHIHAGHRSHDIEVIEEFIERMSHAGSAVCTVRSAGRRRDDELLALKPARPFAMCKARSEDLLVPVLQHGRCIEPVDRELEDDGIGLFQESLLRCHIQMAAALLCNIIDRDRCTAFGSLFQLFQNGLVHDRAFQMRMTGNYNNLCHNDSFFRIIEKSRFHGSCRFKRTLKTGRRPLFPILPRSPSRRKDIP